MGAVEATQSSIDEETKQLWLFGDVDDSMAQLAIPTIQLMDDKDELIRVHIMSDGGCFVTGMAIFDALRATKAMVVTIGHGDVLSTAVSIFLAGDNRVLMPHARMMLHRPYNTCEKGTTADHDRAKAQLDHCENIMLDVWKDLDLPVERYSEAVFQQERELWLTATEAVADGIAHAVVSKP